MRRKGLKLGVGLSGLLFVAITFASPSPLPKMQGIAQDIVNELKANQGNLSGNTALVNGIVERHLVPSVDMHSMAGRVIGRQYWMEATPSQQSTFIGLFKQKILSTYASALTSYNQDRVLFYPMRQETNSYARVRSVIVRRSGQRIPVNYYLRYRNNEWKIVDFSVENVSIVDNYRAQYANTLSHGGLAHLISEMRKQ